VTDIEILIITYGEQTRWAGYYSEGVEADIKNEEAISTLTKLKAEIDRLNAEWMAKCEELRAEVVKECAAVCDRMHCRPEFEPELHDKLLAVAAKHIRALAKKEGA
jgi:hypothetical protein